MAHTPKYRKHPNGQAFVELKKKRYYLGKYDTPESHRNYEEFLLRLEFGETPASPHSSIAAAVQSYLMQVEAGFGKEPSATARRAAMLDSLDLLCGHYGNLLPSQFGPLKLVKLQRLLIEVRYPASRVNEQIREIKRFFRWCVARECVSFTLYFGLSCVEPVRVARPKGL